MPAGERVLCREVRLHHRDELRQARAFALRDAEGFQAVLFAIERLGVKLEGRVGTPSEYKTELRKLSTESPLARPAASGARRFGKLFEGVRQGRNDVMHQGAFARHLTQSSVDLALILEDALMSKSARVEDFMVRSPERAFSWQPLAEIRRTMLLNSFSYLPVKIEDEWKLTAFDLL